MIGLKFQVHESVSPRTVLITSLTQQMAMHADWLLLVMILSGAEAGIVSVQQQHHNAIQRALGHSARIFADPAGSIGQSSPEIQSVAAICDVEQRRCDHIWGRSTTMRCERDPRDPLRLKGARGRDWTENSAQGCTLSAKDHEFHLQLAGNYLSVADRGVGGGHGPLRLRGAGRHDWAVRRARDGSLSVNDHKFDPDSAGNCLTIEDEGRVVRNNRYGASCARTDTVMKLGTQPCMHYIEMQLFGGTAPMENFTGFEMDDGSWAPYEQVMFVCLRALLLIFPPLLRRHTCLFLCLCPGPDMPVPGPCLCLCMCLYKCAFGFCVCICVCGQSLYL